MAEWDKPRILLLGGPTATGKTALSVALAKKLSGEIISADSMQVYTGLSIGTAKATPAEMQGVPHHLVDCLPPTAPYSVADFVGQAGQLIRAITARGRLPILVGGTGLYLSSLMDGLRFSGEKPPEALRRELQRQAGEEGPQAMHRRLAALDPEAARAIHPNNQVRVLRALEACLAAGVPFSQQQAAARPDTPQYDPLLLCLTFADRQQLYQRIDARVDRMLTDGLLAEAETVYQNRDRYPTAVQAIGYKEFFPYFAGEAALEACTEKLKQASRNYAKRQLTWFRHREGVVWLEAGGEQLLRQALSEVSRRWPDLAGAEDVDEAPAREPSNEPWPL